VAQEQIIQYWTAKQRAKKDAKSAPMELDFSDPKTRIQPENASVLFDLMANDLARELRQ
jgi:hypothetical protein